MATFNPTPTELGLVNQVFKVADPSEIGIVTGDAAVKIFAGSKLPGTVLGEIWALADRENNGFLTRKGVAIALRLIGHAQNGETVTEALIDKRMLWMCIIFIVVLNNLFPAAPLARVEGIIAPAPQSSSIPSSPSPRSPPVRGLLQPSLSTEDKTKFLRMFLKCGPVNGLLSGM